MHHIKDIKYYILILCQLSIVLYVDVHGASTSTIFLPMSQGVSTSHGVVNCTLFNSIQWYCINLNSNHMSPSASYKWYKALYSAASQLSIVLYLDVHGAHAKDVLNGIQSILIQFTWTSAHLPVDIHHCTPPSMYALFALSFVIVSPLVILFSL
jgi:hypothetical protein